jgi:hypothetical protein
VDPLLVIINPGQALAAGDWDRGRALQVGLSILVPYCVSTLSSRWARLEVE